jgi:hypothetical protein
MPKTLSLKAKCNSYVAIFQYRLKYKESEDLTTIFCYFYFLFAVAHLPLKLRRTIFLNNQILDIKLMRLSTNSIVSFVILPI